MFSVCFNESVNEFLSWQVILTHSLLKQVVIPKPPHSQYHANYMMMWSYDMLGLNVDDVLLVISKQTHEHCAVWEDTH